MSKSTQDTQSLGINDTYGENLKPVRKVRIPTGLTSSESEDDGENATHVSGNSCPKLGFGKLYSVFK